MINIRTGLLLFIILFALPALVFSQNFSIQGNNEVKWADGKETLGETQTGKRFLENRLNLDLYYDNLRFGTRFTMFQPSEFGETKVGSETLEKRFLEYRDPRRDVFIRAGDFYTVWGRGLTLALYEDIPQGFDSGLDGVLAGGSWGIVEAEVLAGRSKNGWLGLVQEAQVNGAHIAVSAPYGLTFASQAVIVDSPSDLENDAYGESHTWGGYVSYDGSYISAWAEHAQEYVTHADEDNHGTYLYVSGYYGNWGISIDYKNYNYFKYASGQSDSPYTVSPSVLPFHSPPIVQREFTSNLFGKHPHLIRFDDEVGFQVEITWAPGSWGNMVLATSMSSRHPDEDGWIPTVKEEDSPYREVFFEVNSYPGTGKFLSGWAGYSEELIFINEGSVRSRTSWQNRMIIGARLETVLTGEWAGLISAERLAVEKKVADKNYPEARFELGLIYKSNYTLTATLEWSEDESESVTYGEDVWMGPDSWFNLQGRAYIADRHELIVFYGEERGGLVCSSGKCRYVAPFDGAKVTLVSLF